LQLVSNTKSYHAFKAKDKDFDLKDHDQGITSLSSNSSNVSV